LLQPERGRVALPAVSTVAPSRPHQVDLLITLVERGLLLRQKRSMIGLFWPIAAPLVMLLLYSFVFNRVFQVPLRSYPVYLFCGLLPWALFTQGVSTALSSITAESDMVRRAPFPYHMLPLASVCSTFLPFTILLVGFVAVLALSTGVELMLLPLLILPVAALLLFTSAVAMLLSLLDVYNHSMRFLIGNVLTVWFFLVPIVYRPDMAGLTGEILRSVDPINMIVGQFRDILYWGSISRPLHMALMLLASGAAFVISVSIFSRVAPEVPKEL
jgi:ABC-type polysaccharide/polyol phosphate export permease